MRLWSEASDGLSWQEVPDVTPKTGEVLVRVSAAGINRADLLQAAGNYPPPKGASDILGLEVSGTIAEVGEGVDRWAVGEPVCALLSGGGYAEFVAVPQGQIMPVPDTVELHNAAALPEVACTVWSNLVMTADLSAGEVVLIHGGASGIGTHAIQVARALDCRVAVTAGSTAKLDLCKELGAEIVINHRDEDFVEQSARRYRRRRSRRDPRHHRAPPTSTATSTRSPTTAGWSSSACRAASRAS